MHTIHRTTTIMALFACLGLFAASPAAADRCEKGDRVSLPSCVDDLWTRGASQIRVRVDNHCDYPVTVKVDIRHQRDKRFTVQAGGSRDEKYTVLPWASVRNIKCCPRYNRCS